MGFRDITEDISKNIQERRQVRDILSRDNNRFY
jgi:hypothetical protein